MPNSSNARRDGFPAQRRTIMLLVAGGLAGLIPRSGRSGVQPHKTTTAPPMATVVPGLPDLRRLGPAHQVSAISHHGEMFRVTTGDGRVTDFPARNLRFKIDASGLGPQPGVPVIMTAGSIGDRASVFFAAPKEISAFVNDQGAEAKGAPR